MEKQMLDKIYLGADVGGSETKVFYINDGMENFFSENNYVLKHDGYINTEDYIIDEEDYSTKLDLDIKIKAEPRGKLRLDCVKIINEINNNRWLVGRLANAVSVNATQLPLGMKVRTYHYYINIITSIIMTMHELGLNKSEVKLGVLLPARQYFNLDKEMIKEILGGEIEVTNNLTGEKFEIKIIKDDIEVKPEAVVAFSSCFIKNGKITNLGRRFIDKFNLVIDIGENTTDIAGIKAGKPDPVTFHSFDYAGALLLQYIERELQRKLGYYPVMGELRQAISTGYVNQGAGRVWVGEEVSIANREFAEKLFNDFTQYYLLGKGITIQQIASFMFIGGGSVKIDKITSVGEHFIELVRGKSKYAETYSPSEIRKANIQGLADILRMFYKKDKKSNVRQLQGTSNL